MTVTAADLTPVSRTIAEDTLRTLQAADEMTGCDSAEEYVQLMDYLIAALQERRAQALDPSMPEPPPLRLALAGNPTYRW